MLTPTGGFQVEYQCCPQELSTTASDLLDGAMGRADGPQALSESS